MTSISMSSFVNSILRNSATIPLSCREKLSPDQKNKLRGLCQEYAEIASIWSAVGKINHKYSNSSLYVLKRVYDLSIDEKAFSEEGFNSSHSRVYVPTFEGKPWQLGELPTDPEIVAATFTALLDYSKQNKRQHLYDLNLPISTINQF